MNRLTLVWLAVAAVLAACGGGDRPFIGPPPPFAPKIFASPSSIQVNLLGGTPQPFPVTLTDAADAKDLQFGATDLSFLSLSLQRTSSSAATLNVLITGAGNSTITVRDMFASDGVASIPVTSIGCGRPDAVNFARLILPADSAQHTLNTAAYYVEVASQVQPAPFEPVLHAHFVVNQISTIDPQAALSPATPPPNAASPTPPPGPNWSFGYEMGAMPQLASGTTYTVYVYDDSCEKPWNAGSFST